MLLFMMKNPQAEYSTTGGKLFQDFVSKQHCSLAILIQKPACSQSYTTINYCICVKTGVPNTPHTVFTVQYIANLQTGK